MGWEQRGGQLYYYRKIREGDRVQSKYLGRGLVAQLSAETDRIKRKNRVLECNFVKSLKDHEEAIEKQVSCAEATISAVTNAALYAEGYHKHRGQWRKKRNA